MHNCKATRNEVLELLSRGADCALPEELSREMRRCEVCEREFHSLSNTLRLTTRALGAAMPADGYWPAYHARLEEKLLTTRMVDEASSDSATFRFQSLAAVKQFFFSSVRVRTPVAASLLLLFAVSLAGLAWRSRSSERTSISPPPAVVHVPVQVPVVQEKIVTRVVYVPRKTGSRSRQTLNRRAPANDANAFSLLGFKPANDVKLTVIKGGPRDEN